MEISMTAIKLFLIAIMMLSSIVVIFYTYFIATIVTPRVDKYNGYRISNSFAANVYQSSLYMAEFYPSRFVRSLESQQKIQGRHQIEERDLKLYYLCKCLLYFHAILLIIGIGIFKIFFGY
jgi:hypothetical protein